MKYHTTDFFPIIFMIFFLHEKNASKSNVFTPKQNDSKPTVFDGFRWRIENAIENKCLQPNLNLSIVRLHHWYQRKRLRERNPHAECLFRITRPQNIIINLQKRLNCFSVCECVCVRRRFASNGLRCTKCTVHVSSLLSFFIFWKRSKLKYESLR